MTLQMQIIVVLVAAGAAVGVILGTKKVKKHPYTPEVESPLSMKTLIAHAIVLNIMEPGDILKWCTKQKEKHSKEELLFVVGRINDNTRPMITTDKVIPEDMDKNAYLFLEAMDKNKKQLLDVQFFCCSGISSELYDLLKDEDFQIIKDR